MGYFVCMFVCVDALRPSQLFFSRVRMILIWVKEKCRHEPENQSSLARLIFCALNGLINGIWLPNVDTECGDA